MDSSALERAKQAVVTVGDGRGFVVEGKLERPYVITAAHCLPELPPAHGMSYLHERTYQKLLGALGEAPSVWAECVFADPVADIAVLSEPEGQELFDQCAAYEELTEKCGAILIADTPQDYQPIMIRTFDGEMIEAKSHHQSLTTKAWLLSLDGRWFACEVKHQPNGPLRVTKAAEEILGGMSGSPIVMDDGSAIGIVCLGSTKGGHNPRLMANLPGWLLADLTRA